MRQVSRAEADRLGGPTDRPAEDLVSWTNPRTDRTIEIDRGLDPSWAVNPGRDRERILADRLAGTLDAADEALAREAVRQVVGSPLLDRQLAPPQGPAPGDLPVGLLDRESREALKVETRLVRLTARTAAKQSRDHADVTAEAWREILPAVLSGARVVIRETAAKGGIEGDLVLFWASADGRIYKVALAARGRRYVRLKTFHRARPSTVRSARRRGDALRDLAWPG